MKTKKSLRVFTLISLSLMAVLLLSACNFPLFNMGSTATPESPSGDMPAAPTEAATMSSDMGSGGGGSCLVGRWTLSDFSSYFNSINNLLPANAGVSVTGGDYTGSAIFDFGADGNGSFIADNFSQNYTVNIDAGGNPMEIPTSLVVNGTATMKYTVEGDEITFSDQAYGDTTIQLTMMGSTTNLENNLLGDPGTIKVYQYSCVDANTLSLKVIAVDADLAPLILTRVP